MSIEWMGEDRGEDAQPDRASRSGSAGDRAVSQLRGGLVRPRGRSLSQRRLRRCRRRLERGLPVLAAPNALQLLTYAKALLALDRAEAAVEALDRHAPVPAAPSLRAVRGEAYRRLGRLAEARVEFDAALAAEPGEVTAGQGLVRMLSAQNAWRGAAGRHRRHCGARSPEHGPAGRPVARAHAAGSGRGLPSAGRLRSCRESAGDPHGPRACGFGRLQRRPRRRVDVAAAQQPVRPAAPSPRWAASRSRIWRTRRARPCWPCSTPFARRWRTISRTRSAPRRAELLPGPWCLDRRTGRLATTTPKRPWPESTMSPRRRRSWAKARWAATWSSRMWLPNRGRRASGAAHPAAARPASVLFPGYLPHRTLPTGRPGQRISIAFIVGGRDDPA